MLIPRRYAASRLWRIGVVAVLAGAGVLAPVQLARGAPETRFAVLPAGADAAPTSGFTAAALSGPAVPGPAGDVVGSEFPLSHVALRWAGREDALVHLRVAAADLTDSSGGGWGPWQSMLVDHDMTDGGTTGKVMSQLVRVDGARRFQARATGDARQIEIVAVDARFGPRPWVLAKAGPAHAADPPPKEEAQVNEDEGGGTTANDPNDDPLEGEAVPQPDVVTRSEWGADESLRKGEPKFAPVTKLFVHHTVTSPGESDPDPASTVRAIYAYHTQGNGWDDIGYNFLVDPKGRIYEGRSARSYAKGEMPTGEDEQGNGVVGAHAAGYNFGSAAVAVMGDFTSVEPSSPAMNAVQRMMAWKADRHDINPEANDPFTGTDGVTRTFPNLAGHRDVGSTACPGDRLYPLLPGLRRSVAGSVSVAHTATRGYWTATADGRILPFGDASSLGSLAGQKLNAPVSGLAPTPTGNGYWILGGDGGVFSFGDAKFFGSTGNIKLNKPVVRLEATPTGKGYWLVASDGGIFAFGDAGFFGSTGNIKLNQPIVGMATTPTGKGYWLVASDGGIFAYGDAAFFGSTGNIKLNSPVVSMAPAKDGQGYWLVARDGGMFAFKVPFYGSVPGLGPKNYPGSVQVRTTPSGLGYYVADSGGGILSFGDARFHGADATQKAPNTAVDLGLRP